MSANSVWVGGWGVVRLRPWHFVALFSTSRPAELKAAEMGEGYVVRYGDLRLGSEEFEFSGPTRLAPMAPS